MYISRIWQQFQEHLFLSNTFSGPFPSFSEITNEWCYAKKAFFNPFVPNVPFHYSQEVEKGCIGNKWVKHVLLYTYFATSCLDAFSALLFCSAPPRGTSETSECSKKSQGCVLKVCFTCRDNLCERLRKLFIFL